MAHMQMIQPVLPIQTVHRCLMISMNQAIFEGSGHQLKVEAPFVNMTKAEVVKMGLELNAPYELTWSCYEGKDVPCGKCGTCIDRAAAFAANGVSDPAIK